MKLLQSLHSNSLVQKNVFTSPSFLCVDSDKASPLYKFQFLSFPVISGLAYAIETNPRKTQISAGILNRNSKAPTLSQLYLVVSGSNTRQIIQAFMNKLPFDGRSCDVLFPSLLNRRM